MARLSAIALSEGIQGYSQGVAQRNILAAANFLAPSVDVFSIVGEYPIYSAKNRFRVPNTLREPGSRAVQITMGRDKGTFSVKPHAVDVPWDYLEEEIEPDFGESLMRESADLAAAVGALVHEKTVVDLAVTTLTGAAGTIAFTTASTDVVGAIDAEVEAIKLTGGGTGLNSVRVLFGITAARNFKNHATVRSRFTNQNRQSGGFMPTFQDASSLLLGNPETMIAEGIYDTTPEGVTASMAFMLANSIIIFLASQSPTRLDPSFMKTFRLSGKWMVPGTYEREDGRGSAAKFDWSEDVKVTNTAGGKLLTGT